MNTAALKVTLDGDIAPLESKLKAAQVSTERFAKSAATTGAVLSNGLKNGSNQAGFALQNLGRVAQDAPFGFIGIQNNINPLLESFQRLKAETGSTGAALKSLGSSLIGAGGIGLAVSVITALLVVFGDKLFATDKALDSVNFQVLQFEKNIKLAKDSLKSFSEELDFNEKLFAINVTARLGPGFETDMAKARSRFISLGDEIEQLTKKENDLNDNRSNALSALLKNASASTSKFIASFNYDVASIPDKAISKLAEDQQEFVNAAKNSAVALTELQGKMEGIRKERDLQRATIRGIELEEDRNQKKRAEDEAKRLSGALTVAKVLAQMRSELQLINVEQKALGINADDYKKKIQAVEGAIKTLVGKLKVAPDGGLINNLLGEVSDIRLQETVRRIKIGLESQLIAAPVDVPLGTSPTNFNDYINKVKEGLILRLKALKIKFNPFDNAEGLQVTLDEAEKKLAEFKEKATSIMKDTSVSIFTAFGDGVAAAITGQKNVFGSFFATILKSLGNGIRQLGIASIAASKLILKIKATLGTTAGLASGIALVALGSIITFAASKIKLDAFANGVQRFGGGMALVGEQGPEIVSLPSGSSVTPNHAIGAMGIGGGQQIFIAESRIDGKDIVISYHRASKSISRVA